MHQSTGPTHDHALHSDQSINLRRDCCRSGTCDEANKMSIKRLGIDESLFCNVWNGFAGKTSSIPEDMHSIFANALDLSASDMMALPDAGARMKAIIKSLNWVPIGILIDSPPAYMRKAQMKPVVDTAPWISRYPGERGIIREAGGNMLFRVTCKGLRLDWNSPSRPEKPRLVCVETQRSGQEKRLITLPSAGEGYWNCNYTARPGVHRACGLH